MPRTKTLSADFYHSSSVFDQEIKNIFKKEWLWVARSDELSEPGSFLTTEIIEYPIIVLRDHSDNLRAYHNVCRHRAAKVCLLYTSPSPRDRTRSRMPSSA